MIPADCHCSKFPRRRLWAFLCAGLAGALGVLSAASVGAHSQSSSRLLLDLSESQPPAMTIDIALIDLSQALDLDLDANGSVTWGELTSPDTGIVKFVANGVQIWRGSDKCRLETSARNFSLVERADNTHLRLGVVVLCPEDAGGDVHVLRYGMFFGINPAHRALLRVRGVSSESVHVLSPANAELRLRRGRSAASPAAFVAAGVDHILSGYDHLVFLALLILPAAGSGVLRQKLIRIALIVTAFTVAHSITLAAATTGLIRLAAGPVEIGIAASIVLAAVLNVIRPAHNLSWQVAFAFGLLHGFGFAGALQEMSLGSATMLASLLAFNVGVEIGQLLVVALILPILALLSVSARYRSVVVPAVSLAGAALGVIWTAARL